MEVEAVDLETRGLLLEEGKPAQGYGPQFHVDEIVVSKRSEAFARPGAEKAVADRPEAAAWTTAPAEEFAARNKAAPAERVFAAGNKAAQAEEEEEEEEAKSAGAVKKTTKKKTLVRVSQDHINLPLEHPPNPTLSHRLRSFTEESSPFAHSDPEGRREILDMIPAIADSMDEFYRPQLEILRQYKENGIAYEEIEVDEEIEPDEEGN